MRAHLEPVSTSSARSRGENTPTAERETANAHLEDPATDHCHIVLVEIMVYITPSHTSPDDGNTLWGMIFDTIETRHVKQNTVVYVCA